MQRILHLNIEIVSRHCAEKLTISVAMESVDGVDVVVQ